MPESSKFTFLLAQKAQDSLKVGPRLYHEMKKIFISTNSDHVHGFKEPPPEYIQSYLLVSAMRTQDMKVRDLRHRALKPL